MPHTLSRSLFSRAGALCIVCLAFFSLSAAAKDPSSPDALAAPPAGYGFPVLRIVYAAGTKGELFPCNTCGAEASGGLARRMSRLERYRADPGATVVIFGPDEFLADAFDPSGAPLAIPRVPQSALSGMRPVLPPQEKARQAHAAYTLLRPDAAWLSPLAAGWLAQAGGVPAGFTRLEGLPETRVLSTPAGALGVVFFPRGEEPGKRPSDGQIRAVLEAGRSLQPQVRMVVGVSPWGLEAEKNFLPRAETVFSCLLGGGDGVAFSHSSLASAPATLWLRPETGGRALTVLEMFTLPDNDPGFSWLEGITFSAALEYLGPEHAGHPAMERLLGPARVPGS